MWLKPWSTRRSVTLEGSDRQHVRLRIEDDAEIAARAQISGRDIVFTESDGVTKAPHELVSYRAWLQDDAVWTWFNGGAAVRHVGAKDCTYIGWISTDGSIWIGQYNHGDESWATFELHSELEVDDHNNPSILVRSDGKIVVAYSKHLDEAQHYVRISTNAEDISAWEDVQTLTATNNCSYAHLIYLDDEDKIYLFFRHGFSRAFRTSDDGGETWSAPTTFITNGAERPYLLARRNGTARIDFSVTDGHPRDNDPNRIYHCYYEDGSFYKSDGTLIKTLAAVAGGSPLTPADMTVAYDDYGWNWDIAVDSQGRVVQAIIDIASNAAPDDFDYKYLILDGGTWTAHTIANSGGRWDYANEGHYAPGITVDKNDPRIVYYVRRDSTSSSWKLYKATTSDDGETWTESDAITGDAGTRKIGRPYCPENAHPSMPVVWWDGRYTTYIDYATRLCSHVALHADVDVVVPPDAAWMYYGNPNASDQQDAAALYEDAALVAHGVAVGVNNAGTPQFKGTVPSSNLAQAGAMLVDGVVFEAMAFDDNSDIIIGPALNLNGATEWTIAVTAKFNSGASGNNHIVSNWRADDNTHAGIIVRYDASNGELDAFAMTSGGQIGGAFSDLTVSADTFHRVVVRFKSDGTGLEAWLDGVKSATTYATADAMAANDTRASRIGGTPHLSQPLVGAIESLSVERRAWSDDEIDDDAAWFDDHEAYYVIGEHVDHGYRVYLRTTRTGSDTQVRFVPPGSDAVVIGGLAADQYLHVRAVSCGQEDIEPPKLRRVRFDGDGALLLPCPNAPSALRLVRGAGGAMMAKWIYIENGQEAPPAAYNVYVAEDEDPFDFETPTATVNASSRLELSADLGTFEHGTEVRVIVRSVSADGAEDPNAVEVSAVADSAPPEAPSSVSVEVTTQ